MRISLLQMDIAWCDRTENLRRANELLYSAGDADVYVLPEMWDTGFAVSPSTPPPSSDSDALAWMLSVARSRNAAVCGSTAIVDADGLWRNRLYFAGPDGLLACYDKRHLFTMGGENEYFHRGERRVVVDFRGVRFLLATCYDLRFPVWLRNHNDYDVLLCVASWPSRRRHVWDVLLQARALENQCYTVGCNRVGNDPNCQYDGGSKVVSPRGELLASAANDIQTVTSADIDMESLRAFRKKFNVLNDRDEFSWTEDDTLAQH